MIINISSGETDARTLVSRRRRQVGKGGMCGGFAGARCTAGLRCKMNDFSTAGTCVSNKGLITIDSIKFLKKTFS